MYYRLWKHLKLNIIKAFLGTKLVQYVKEVKEPCQ